MEKINLVFDGENVGKYSSAKLQVTTNQSGILLRIYANEPGLYYSG